MVRPSPTPEWQQYYPTYKLGHPEIAVAEYEAASVRTKDDENTLAIANGILVAALVPTLPIVAPYIEAFLVAPSTAIDKTKNLAIFLLAALFVSVVLCAYIGQLRRSYVFSARKVIVLRRMLGQSYGGTTLVLPNWRLEGADNAFSIKLFPGWRMQSSYPYFALAAITATLVAYGCHIALPGVGALNSLPTRAFGLERLDVAVAIAWLASWTGTLAYIRISLYDYHESTRLLFTKLSALLLGVKLTKGIQTTLYSARLARFEAKRVNIDLTTLKKFAVRREDRAYFAHNGVDLHAIARASINRLKGIKAGGGTTITQQVARTLFIISLHRRITRKLVEVMLAGWLSRLVDKDELLEIYLCSVRYGMGVFGVAAALKHYFGRRAKLNPARCFILVERVSNVSGDFKADTVQLMLDDFMVQSLLLKSDLTDVIDSYEELIKAGKIHAGPGRTPRDVEASLVTKFAAYP